MGRLESPFLLSFAVVLPSYCWTGRAQPDPTRTVATGNPIQDGNLDVEKLKMEFTIIPKMILNGGLMIISIYSKA